MNGTSNELTLLSAFTGLGGLDLGLEAAGFSLVGCIENNEAARVSLKTNREGGWPLLEPGDISLLVDHLAPERLGLRRGELSLLAGGPPCQPFSKAGQWCSSSRIGLDDERSNCLHDFLRLVEAFLPHIVLIENVSGFVRGPVSALGEIERTLSAINRRQDTQYRCEHRIVDAADYGVPQRRQRAIIILSRSGTPPTWPSPTHHDNPIRAWDAIGNLRIESPPRAVGKWAELLPSIPEGENYLWHTRRGGGKPIFGYRTRYWSFLLKLARDQPSWTLPAQPGPSTGPFHWDNRPLAISEALRLQSFDPEWAVEGSYREQLRQVGNATPPLLAEVFGREIASTFFGRNNRRRPLRFSIDRARTVPQPTPPTAVPSKYGRLAGPHPDHPGTGLGPNPRL